MKKFEISKRQWITFSIWAVLYLLFCLWMQNGWLLFGLLLFVDIYLTKFIPWGAWRKVKNPKLRNLLNWVDDIVFALVAVYFINLFVFQNYQIPTPSLEKTLLVGDYLFVSKLSYGPRVPNTPLSFPLVQHTFPILNTKSYFDWPQWGYKRVKGLGEVKRNDIVVFNFPAGDTVAVKQPNPDYYTWVEMVGRDRLWLDKATYGDIVYRPVDKRDNYVKRCVGMPGDSLKIVNNQLYINGEAQKNPEHMQLNYYVESTSLLTEDQFRLLDVSQADRSMETNTNVLEYIGITPNESGQLNYVYNMPLTQKAVETARKLSNVKNVIVQPDIYKSYTYPLGYKTGWTPDNYGPIWIPRKGETIELNEKNLAIYARCIRNYEGNTLEIKDGQVFINGKPEKTFTFKYDYYWMMGDNRHNSADSRSWGFVPEDHVIGKPLVIWLSLDKDRGIFDGGIRWNRIFRKASAD